MDNLEILKKISMFQLNPNYKTNKKYDLDNLRFSLHLDEDHSVTKYNRILYEYVKSNPRKLYLQKIIENVDIKPDEELVIHLSSCRGISSLKKISPKVSLASETQSPKYAFNQGFSTEINNNDRQSI